MSEREASGYGWPVDLRPEPEPPGPSPWPALLGGLIATVVVSGVLGILFTWPFGLMVGGVMLVLTLAVAWGVTHPPDPFAQTG
jgi:hypothetical protein